VFRTNFLVCIALNIPLFINFKYKECINLEVQMINAILKINGIKKISIKIIILKANS